MKQLPLSDESACSQRNERSDADIIIIIIIIIIMKNGGMALVLVQKYRGTLIG